MGGLQVAKESVSCNTLNVHFTSRLLQFLLCVRTTEAAFGLLGNQERNGGWASGSRFWFTRQPRAQRRVGQRYQLSAFRLMDPTRSFWDQGMCLIIHRVNLLRSSNDRGHCYLTTDNGFCTHIYCDSFITILAVTTSSYIPRMFLLIVYISGTGDHYQNAHTVECRHIHGQTSPWHISEHSAIKKKTTLGHRENCDHCTLLQQHSSTTSHIVNIHVSHFSLCRANLCISPFDPSIVVEQDPDTAGRVVKSRQERRIG